ncbi:MAG: diguanylate cyclase, partial [bacterium]|nr:diguanylate cyclase [bacterium]
MPLLRDSMPDIQSRPMTLMVALGLAESGTEVAASWISGAFVHIARLWPLILLAKMCIISLLHVGFYRPGDPAHAAIMAAMLLCDGTIMLVPRWRTFQQRMPHIQTWLMLPMIFLSALTFSLWLGTEPKAASDTLFLAAVPELAIALLAVCIFGDRRLLGISYFLGALLVSV